MKLFNLKKLAAITAFGFVAILGTSVVANAQRRDRDDDKLYDQNEQRRINRQQQRAERQRAKIEQQRIELERQRQADWTRRNSRITNVRTRGNSNYGVNPNANRYRVYRNGSYYNTDNRGAELLRQAVNKGYRKGFAAGRGDRNGRRNSNWSNSSDYRNGSYGYQNHVNRGQYQYYFRQGFQRGYQDGSNSRFENDYNGQYEYGSYDNGSANILGTILNQILNLQSY